jgi:hypothetical protein
VIRGHGGFRSRFSKGACAGWLPLRVSKEAVGRLRRNEQLSVSGSDFHLTLSKTSVPNEREGLPASGHPAAAIAKAAISSGYGHLPSNIASICSGVSSISDV